MVGRTLPWHPAGSRLWRLCRKRLTPELRTLQLRMAHALWWLLIQAWLLSSSKIAPDRPCIGQNFTMKNTQVTPVPSEMSSTSKLLLVGPCRASASTPAPPKSTSYSYFLTSCAGTTHRGIWMHSPNTAICNPGKAGPNPWNTSRSKHWFSHFYFWNILCILLIMFFSCSTLAHRYTF